MVAWGRSLEHDKRLLQEENARLKAEVERLTKQNALATPRSLIASQDIQSLKAEVERLTADLPKMVAWGRGLEHDKRLLEEENDRLKAELAKSEEHNEALCERMQDLNSELFSASNINGKLHMKRVHDLNQMGGQCEEIARLKAEVERLTKAGDLMCRMAGNNQVINRHWKTAKKGGQS